MFRSLPPLSTLKAFEATARLGSMGRAAQELGRTHGAVSRQLSALQEHAGVALFEKKGTGLQLNAHGEAFHRVVAQALGGLEQGYRRLKDEARGPGVHVACSATFAMRWLVPHLAEFYREHPGLSIRLSMTSAREIRDEGAEIVLTWDRLSFPIWDEDRAIRLADVSFGPVCAPTYRVSFAAGRLEADNRIAHEHTSRAWENWQAASQLSLTTQAELAFPHTHLCIEAAVAGLGIALIERRLVRDELASGRLIAPCGWVRFPDGFAAMPTSDRADSPPVRAFVTWIKRVLASDP